MNAIAEDGGWLFVAVRLPLLPPPGPLTDWLTDLLHLDHPFFCHVLVHAVHELAYVAVGGGRSRRQKGADRLQRMADGRGGRPQRQRGDAAAARCSPVDSEASARSGAAIAHDGSGERKSKRQGCRSGGAAGKRVAASDERGGGWLAGRELWLISRLSGSSGGVASHPIEQLDSHAITPISKRRQQQRDTQTARARDQADYEAESGSTDRSVQRLRVSLSSDEQLELNPSEQTDIRMSCRLVCAWSMRFDESAAGPNELVQSGPSSCVTVSRDTTEFNPFQKSLESTTLP